MKKILLLLAIIVFSCSGTFAQKYEFINSDSIRVKFPEAKQAEQRIQSIVEEWKRELSSMQEQIENIQLDVKNNGLIWTENERLAKDKELQSLLLSKETYAKNKFEPNGEYDLMVKQIMKPIEDKIEATRVLDRIKNVEK